ncbi:MAG TPA: hypothetical protein OIL76_04780 [Veillonellaceae bacterium]|nr:hypothetical protein [Veillonellaceae bacterium]
MDVKQKINVAIVTLLLLAASSLGLAYEVYDAGQQPVHHMTYEEAVKATEKDCCR